MKKKAWIIAISVLLVGVVLAAVFIPRGPAKLSDMNPAECVTWIKEQQIQIPEDLKTMTEDQLGVYTLRIILDVEQEPEALADWGVEDRIQYELAVSKAVNAHYQIDMGDFYEKHASLNP